MVHVALSDALAHASWRGKELPTETEWEPTRHGAEYVWGDEFTPGRAHGQHLARRVSVPESHEGWLGLDLAGHRLPPNGYVVYDIVGDISEWTSDW